MAAIRHPTLLLAAEDDPLIPGESVTKWPLPASGVVVREMLPTGGHVGFVAPTDAPGRFWAAERAMAFLRGDDRRSASTAAGERAQRNVERSYGSADALRRSVAPASAPGTRPSR